MEPFQLSIVARFPKILPEYFSGAQLFDKASPATSSSQQHGQLRGPSSVDRFDQLHQDLSKILAGRNCDSKIILLGSEVKFTGDGGDELFIYKIEVP